MAVPKTYFVMTNFDLSPNNPIQLGSIIADPLEPEEILNPGDVLQIPSNHVRTSHKRDWDITESLQNGRFSITAQFIASLKLDDITDITGNFSLQDVETLDFVPSQSYVDEAVNKRSVRDYLEGCQYKLPVYMVTGLKIGRGLSKNLPLGPRAGDSSIQEALEQNASLGSTPDFIIGYRLVRIIAEEVESMDGPSRDVVMGKMMGDDDGRDTSYGSLRVTLTANIDGGREVEAHEIVGSQAFTVVDEDGGKACNCIVVTQLVQ